MATFAFSGRNCPISILACVTVLTLVCAGCGGANQFSGNGSSNSGGSGGSGGSDGEGSSTSVLTWPMTISTNCSSDVYIRFFDKTANLVWPSSTQVYYLLPGQSNNYALSCKTGDTIFMGASVNSTSDNPYYWGVGITGDEGCSNCGIPCQRQTLASPF
jgi:hypothetical protein